MDMPETNDNSPGCSLCGREKPLTFHHLIPRKCHRNKWFQKNFDKMDMKTRGIEVCRDCHRHIHVSFTEKELGRHYNTREALLEQEEIKKFVEWVRKKG